MNRRLVLSDGDSTLIDTPKFIKVLPRAIEAIYGPQTINAARYESEIRSKQFYVTSGAGYDLTAHLAHYQLTLDPLHRAKLIRSLKSLGQSFVYPDVPDFLRQFKHEDSPDFAILTRGVPELQELKLELCTNELQDIPAEITLENKGDFLSQYWAHGIIYRGQSYDTALYIDDNASELLRAPNTASLKLYQIVRPSQRHPQSNDTRITVVNSLADIPVQA